MKKICYVVTISLSIKSFFVPQLQYLVENGFDVTVVCSPDTNLQIALGDSIRYLPVEIPRGMSLVGTIKAISNLIELFAKEKFDLVQYSTPNAAFCASIAAKLVGCKRRNYHLMGFRYLGASGISKALLKWIEKITCKNSTSIECVSKSNLELGVQDGIFKREKATVVWNGSTGGVDLERFDFAKRQKWRSEVRKELGYSEDDFVYGFAGRITRDKGINELLEAFLNLDTQAKLLLVGRLEDVQSLDPELFKTAQGHPNICFHDAVVDIERYFAAMDVLVLPSYREGFGNVVIEAGAVGTPAIVSDIPGPIDTIDEGKTALTVEVKNVNELTTKMKQIRNADYITMGWDASKYAAEKFSSRELCERILERKRLLLEGEVYG